MKSLAVDSSYFMVNTRQGICVEEFIDRLVNLLLALALFVPSLVIMLPFYAAWLFTEARHGPFLYKGARMGRWGTLFTIYKIRSLVNNAENKIGARLHTHDAKYELWYGRLVRNSRIDELPQLINIIIGDMDFVGPRPIRPAIFEAELRYIPDFARRFSVRPGLTGYSQFYTPHSSPRRLRSRIDNLFIRRNNTIMKKMGFVMLTGVQFVLQIVKEVAIDSCEALDHYRIGAKHDRRRFRRTRLKNASCELCLETEGNSRRIPGRILDINTEAMRLALPDSPDALLGKDETLLVAFVVAHKKHNRVQRERVRCDGTLLFDCGRSGKNPLWKQYIVNYTSSNYDEYKIHKYILKNSYSTL